MIDSLNLVNMSSFMDEYDESIDSQVEDDCTAISGLTNPTFRTASSYRTERTPSSIDDESNLELEDDESIIEDLTPSIVKISFSNARMKRGERGTFVYSKSNESFLTIEVAGHIHSFTHVAECLFSYHMADVLDEELYAHIWRFEPAENGDYKSMDDSLPFLSKKMGYGSSYSFKKKASLHQHLVTVNSNFVFCYDEGSPTHVYVSILSIREMDINADIITNYPRSLSALNTESQTERNNLITSLANKNNGQTMDTAYPKLCQLLISRRSKFEFGNGTANGFVHLWGDSTDDQAYQSCIHGLASFDNMDEFFLCLEKGIIQQQGPDYPKYISKTTIREADGSISVTEVARNSRVHLRPYPTSVNSSSYADEYFDDSFRKEKHMLKLETRWAAAFSLDANWKSQEHFSFHQQFPKCAKWLTYNPKKSYRMVFEAGILSLMTSKQVHGKDSKVDYKSMKHANVHDAFADIEVQLVLPKSWK